MRLRSGISVLLAAAVGCTAKTPARDTASAARSAQAAPSAPLANVASSSPGQDSGGDTTALASESGSVDYFTAADLDRVAQALSRGGTTGRTLRAHPTYSYLQIRRTQNGTPEVHDRWIDVTVVQAGHGTMLSGGRVTGSHAEADGEHRGGVISGGTSRPVRAGDLMMIPAGVPHQYLISPGDSLRYITTKILAAPR